VGLKFFRQRKKLGFVPSTVLACLSAVVVAVLVVQLWTLRDVRAYQMQTAQDMLSSDLALLSHAFGPDPHWARDGSGHLTLNGQPLGNAAVAVNTVRTIDGADATIFDGDVRIATTLSGAHGHSLVGSRLAAGPVHDRVLLRGETYVGQASIAGIRYLTVYKPILDSHGQPIGILFAGTKLTQAAKAIRRIVNEGLVIGFAVTLVVALLSGLALRVSVRPLTALAASVRQIATGDLDHPAPCLDRTDQLGEIGRAVETLRVGVRAGREVEARAEAERAARTRSQAAMDQLTRDFTTTISGVLAKLGHSAEGVRQAAVDMTDVANQTRSDMLGAAAEAESSAQNLSCVASATSELTANGAEISRQVAQVSAATDSAMSEAQATSLTVEGLDETVRQISAIVTLISEIAGQTNLLALNATIEAARAGDAGKGFAVVASEVKQLATQTNKATARIGEQIAAIQDATREAVSAVRNVSGVIVQAGQAAATIAASIDQQDDATREIALQVQTVSQATVNANQTMRSASDLAASSEQKSRSVLAIADQVASLTASLQAEVDDFLAATKASWESGDRRRYERVGGKGLRAKLDCATHGSGEGVIANISLGGVSVACVWPCDIGNETLVRLPGTDRPVSARIVSSRDNMVQLAFRQDPTTLDQVGKTIDLIEAGKAGEPRRAA